MAKVLVLVPAGGRNHAIGQRMEHLIKRDRIKFHSLTNDPGEADIILFVWHSLPYLGDIIKHPYADSYRDKVFVLSNTDKFIPLIPGLYTSIEKSWFDPVRMKPFHYIGVREHEYFFYDPNFSKAEYLFSFIGAFNTHPIRKKLGAIRHPRGLIVDSMKAKNSVLDYKSGSKKVH